MVPKEIREQMRLDMKTRKKICQEIYKRYQKARKKDKAQILEEYAPLLKSLSLNNISLTESDKGTS
jgi:hypothetical protein